MKKILCIVLSIIMAMALVACGNTPTQEPTEKETTPIQTPVTELPTTEPVTEEPTESIEIETEASTGPVEEKPAETLDMVFTYTVYTPNENADGFNEEVVEVNEINPESVLAELQKRNVLPEDVVVNSCSNDEGHVTIDFNQAFADVVCSMGTSGEFVIVGSVVNTYLSALGADSIYFTVDGEILESGHTIYDFVMTKFN